MTEDLLEGTMENYDHQNKKGFGWHFMIDAYGCKQEFLEDINLIYDLMVEVTKSIEMNPLGPPIIYKVSAKQLTHPEDIGISAVIVFAESHFSIHTFPLKSFFSADIYSCKHFQPDDVKSILKETFFAEEIETQFIQRGLKFVRRA